MVSGKWYKVVFFLSLIFFYFKNFVLLLLVLFLLLLKKKICDGAHIGTLWHFKCLLIVSCKPLFRERKNICSYMYLYVLFVLFAVLNYIFTFESYLLRNAIFQPYFGVWEDQWAGGESGFFKILFLESFTFSSYVMNMFWQNGQSYFLIYSDRLLGSEFCSLNPPRGRSA